MKEYYGLIYRYVSPSGKSYIGQTTDELKRKRQHKQAAYNEKDKLYNYKFHTAIRKYGFDSFKYEILYTIFCNTLEELMNILNEKEIYSYTSKGFQWRYGDSKENIGKPNIPKSKGSLGKTGKLNARSKQIYQYSLQGELINIWEGALCAEREAGYSSTHLSKAIKNEVPYGKRGEIKSFWSFVPLTSYEVKYKVAVWNESNCRKYKGCEIASLAELEKDSPKGKDGD